MDEGVQDVFSTNPYLDPYQMRQLNKRYRRDTQKLFCEAPVSLREALKVHFNISVVVRFKDLMSLYVLNHEDEDIWHVVHSLSVDSSGDEVHAEDYDFPNEDSPYPPADFTMSSVDLLIQTKIQFIRFGLGTIAEVLLNRGCSLELVSELLLLDVESAKNDIKDKILLERYFVHSVCELDDRDECGPHYYVDDPEEKIRRRLVLLGGK